MLQTIRRNINPTTFVAVVALVFAMSGGAYAATKYLITSTKQISPKVLKSLQGKDGKNGTAGATGAQGAAGPQGPAGTPGATGAAGPEGKAGQAGASGEPGSQGAKGKEGSPWTVSGTLPPGKTETGSWGLGGTPTNNDPYGNYSALSFPIPLEADLGAGSVHYINGEGKEVPGSNSTPVAQTACPGTAASPSAEPGNLCVYEGEIFPGVGSDEFNRIVKPGSASGVEEKGASTAGALLKINLPDEEAEARGTFAVTEPTE